MELMELYDRIQNPLDDPTVIEKLIQAYSKSELGLFYNKLTKTIDKKYNGQYYAEDGDRFFSMMFNQWKNNVISMTKERFIELRNKGSFGNDFIKMREFLKTLSDVTTMKEANDILDGNNDREIADAIEKYNWKALGKDSGWIHVCSRYVTAKKDEYSKIDHRLYLNTESIDTYKMISLIVEKMDQNQLPYYFKFDQFGNRDDTIVIYSDSQHLIKYVELLNEIKQEHPDLVSRFKSPPVLTGKINDWIGYGSEPGKTPDGKLQSFNQVRSKAIESAISKVTKKWIMDHRNMQIKYQGQQISFQDYIAMKSTERLLIDMQKKYDYKLENKTDIDVASKYGYTLSDIQSPSIKQSIYNVIRAKIGISLELMCTDREKEMQSIEILVRDGKKVSFSYHNLSKIIMELSELILKNDKNFATNVKTEIINNSKQYGIDTDKYCFDTRTKENMRMIDASKVQIQSTQKAQVSQVLESNVPNVKSKKIINPERLDVQTFPEIINPSLIERKIKLPNGSEISAKRYIQEIVFSHIPSNGRFILANGAEISAKQFIEEGIMFECQEKYNGDLAKYLVECTRSNQNIISIKNNGVNYQIHPIEIVDFLNPALLEKKMKLPNGTEMSARQYIQEIYAPHIPTNGTVLNSNGAEISVRQYIEEHLLWEGQDKYNGDIGEILFNTTRANKGIIDITRKREIKDLYQLKTKAQMLENNQVDPLFSNDEIIDNSTGMK